MHVFRTYVVSKQCCHAGVSVMKKALQSNHTIKYRLCESYSGHLGFLLIRIVKTVNMLLFEVVRACREWPWAEIDFLPQHLSWFVEFCRTGTEVPGNILSILQNCTETWQDFQTALGGNAGSWRQEVAALLWVDPGKPVKIFTHLILKGRSNTLKLGFLQSS